MIKNTFLILMILGLSNLYAQDLFIKTGKNNTSYDFTSPNNNNEISYRNNTGDFYEIGYQFNLKNPKFSYSVSLTYNQFNAAAFYANNSYSWKANYIGIQNVASYAIYKTTSFRLSFLAGFNTATLVNGDQFINTTYYSIKNDEEFSGLVVQPLLGAEIRYFVSKKISISLGYNYSRTFNLSNSLEEKLSFNTSQFQFGIHIPLTITNIN